MNFSRQREVGKWVLLEKVPPFASTWAKKKKDPRNLSCWHRENSIKEGKEGRHYAVIWSKKGGASSKHLIEKKREERGRVWSMSTAQKRKKSEAV